jgi:hypothetical protein
MISPRIYRYLVTAVGFAATLPITAATWATVWDESSG